MGDVVVCGSGSCGLLTAMVLARSGHRVSVLERDPCPPPAAHEAWDSWERRGVNQFRLPHFLMPAFRQLAERELPGVIDRMEEAGAARFNFLGPLAPVMDPEGRYDVVTARRPVLEWALASAAEETAGVRIQRGVPLAGLLYGRQGADGIPHVRGVRTEAGEEICADLVVDAMGRRSPLQRWLTADGLNPGTEAVEDSGFVYYGCHIRLDGPPQPPIINYYGSISVMILPADNGTAGVGIIGWSGDVALRPLRHEAHWRAALELYPEGEMILAGTPIGGMVTMAGIEDRRRGFMAEGRPVVTGLVSVADAWAATNPALGRGISLGFRHVIHLRDTLDAVGLGQPLALARTFGEVTERDLGPWYESTIWHDRHRLGDAIASAREEEREHDGEWDLFLRFMSAFRNDPVLGMRFLETALLTETPNQLLADPEVRSRLADVPEPQPAGPSRAELLAAISG